MFEFLANYATVNSKLSFGLREATIAFYLLEVLKENPQPAQVQDILTLHPAFEEITVQKMTAILRKLMEMNLIKRTTAKQIVLYDGHPITWVIPYYSIV